MRPIPAASVSPPTTGGIETTFSTGAVSFTLPSMRGCFAGGVVNSAPKQQRHDPERGEHGSDEHERLHNLDDGVIQY